MNFLTKIVQFLKPGEASTGGSGDPEFMFTNLPQSWGVFVFIGCGVLLLYLVYLFYRKEAVPIGNGARSFLIGVRGLVMLLLLLVLLGPAVRYFSIRVIEPTIFLARDASQSMNHRDRYVDEAAAMSAATAMGLSIDELREKRPTRAEIVGEVLKSSSGPDSVPEDPAEDESSEDKSLVGSIGEKGTMKVFDFAEGLSQVADISEYNTRGQLTDITLPINEALEDKNTSAVILFTHGHQTAKSDPRSAARRARDRGIPVFVVGVGDEERPKNVEVAEVYADPQVWKDDPFEIQVLVRGQGLAEETINLELVESTGEGDAASEKVIQRRPVNVDPETGQVRTIFSHTVREPGTRSYTVRAGAIDGETNPDDNQPPSAVPVKILDQKARVLLISGLPTWGYRSVTQLLMREKSIDLSCWLQSIDDGRAQPGNTPIVELPSTRDALFEYDVILMFDPDPKEFDEAWVGLMKDFVREHAGGCLYQAGPNFTGRFLTGTRTGSMATLLPVMLDDVGRMDLLNILGRNDRSWPLGVVASNVDQPMMRFFPEPGQSLALWKTLPGVYWTFPAKEAKPAARVLIEHTDPASRKRPLLVAGQYGSGKIVYQGFNSTWRWRQVGRDAEFFKRFWIQTVRFLIEGRSLEGRRRGMIEPERPRYQLGDRVQLIARLKDAGYNPLEVESVDAQWRNPSGEIRELSLRGIPGQPGEFEAAINPVELGAHGVKITGLDFGLTGGSIESTFSVSLPQIETEKIWLDTPLLKDIAKISGGKYLAINEVGGLADLIPEARREDRIPRPPIPLWDTWPILAILVGLLCIEWIVRKRLKLL